MAGLTIAEIEAEWYALSESGKYAWANRRMADILDLLHWYAQQSDDLLFELAQTASSLPINTDRASEVPSAV